MEAEQVAKAATDLAKRAQKQSKLTREKELQKGKAALQRVKSEKPTIPTAFVPKSSPQHRLGRFVNSSQLKPGHIESIRVNSTHSQKLF